MQFWRLPDPDRRDEQVARVINRVLRAPIRGCLQEDADGRRRHCTGHEFNSCTGLNFLRLYFHFLSKVCSSLGKKLSYLVPRLFL